MSKIYTDKEVASTAKLAYFNFEQNVIDRYVENIHIYPTVKDILNYLITEKNYDYTRENIYEIYTSYEGDDSDGNNAVKDFIDSLLGEDSEGNVVDLAECANWKIVGVKDENVDNGFYGVAFETSDDSVILGFRGSEGGLKQGYNDWVAANLSISTGTSTTQERKAADFLTEFLDNDKYNHVSTSGHSLGGNLAFDSAILSALNSNIYKLEEAVSLDGQGHPDSFYDYYSKEVDIVKDRLYHYRWSLVGEIYNQPTDYDKWLNYDLVMTSAGKLQNPIEKHSIMNLKFNGSNFNELYSNVHNYSSVKYTTLGMIKTLEKSVGFGTKHVVNNEAVCNLMTNVYANIYSGTFNNDNLDNLIKEKIDMISDERAYGNTDSGKWNADNERQEITDKDYYLSAKKGVENIIKENVKASLRDYDIYVDDAYIDSLVHNKLNCDDNVFEQSADGAKDILADSDRKYYEAEQAVRIVVDPLVIDLDDDGIELTSVEDGVYFDEDNKGLKEKTQWIGKNEALLANDINGDGIINNGSELFGESTVVGNGKLARTGFEALSFYDSNKDGRIDLNDDVYGSLRVWQDRNSNGISELDELSTLENLGIESISLEQRDDEYGRKTSSVNFTNGTLKNITEIDFGANYYDVQEHRSLEYSEEIMALPDVIAIGNVKSLHTLMSEDKSGELIRLVKDFLNSETNIERENNLEKILFFITGADSIDPKSRGNQIDARHLHVIEQVMGRDFVGTGGSNPVNTAAPILNGIYDDILDVYRQMLVSSSSLKENLELTFWMEDRNGNKVLNTTFFDMYARSNILAGNNVSLEVADLAKYISIANSNNKNNLYNFVSNYMDDGECIESFKAVIHGITFGNLEGKTIRTGSGDDTIIGSASTDSIYSEGGEDVIIGGKGNDYLEGGNNNDKYIFNVGDGEDTIFDVDYNSGSGKADRIVFGEGITLDNVKMQRSGKNLVINYGNGDKVTIVDAYRVHYSQEGLFLIENIEFSDGTVIGFEEAANIANHLDGTDGDDKIDGFYFTKGYNGSEVIHGLGGNDTIRGNEGNDEIHGDEGNDSLYGDDGDDTLIGGKGNDYLEGGNNNDKYIFNIGDGEDTIFDVDYNSGSGKADRIIFGEGITLDNVKMQRSGNNLVIKYGQNDKVTIVDAYRIHYSQEGLFLIENIEFADGTVIGFEEAANIANHLDGTDGNDEIKGFYFTKGYNGSEVIHGFGGNDTIHGNEGNDEIFGDEGNDALYGDDGDDTLIGGKGNDYLEGGNNNDKYIFNIGDGEDTIFDVDYNAGSGKADRIVFGEGITLDNVKMQRSGNNLVIKYGQNDKVTIVDAYRIHYSQEGLFLIENIEFSDGTVIGFEEAANIANHLDGTDGNDNIGGFYFTKGYNGSEVIHGLAGNDTIHGNEGNDEIYGDEGNDSLYGDDGDDTLIGGKGNDYLEGGNNNDKYIFNIGDGEDTIFDVDYNAGSGKADRIVFGEGITLDNIKMQRSGNNLVIKYGQNDKVTIVDAYRIHYSQEGLFLIENIEFSDGTVIGFEEAVNIANHLDGTNENDNIGGFYFTKGYNGSEVIHGLGGNDTIHGNEGNDEIYGDEGNDGLYGDDGDDTLIGGKGNDYLEGGNNNDKYIFNIGDGEDTIFDVDYNAGSGKADRIVFGEGITLDNIKMQRSGKNLVIHYGNGDKVTIVDAYRVHYSQEGLFLIENIEFSDGTVIGFEEAANIANHLDGTSGDDEINGFYFTKGYNGSEVIHGLGGNDTIHGNEGNDEIFGDEGNDSIYGDDGDDTLIGGKGNDYLEGGNNNDKYIFNIGDGEDVIFDVDYNSGSGKADRIIFGEGITLDNVKMQRSGNNLVIKYGKNDKVTVVDAYRIHYSQEGLFLIENIEFSDGTVIGFEEAANIANHLDGTDGNDEIRGFYFTKGYNGNEVIHGLGGNDTIHGNEGNDEIHGDEGNDSLYGDDGDDTLIGGKGNDYLEGGNGRDILVGGQGDDTLVGGVGADIYYIGKDDENTFINNYSYDNDRGIFDKIVFGKGIKAESINVSSSGSDLLLTNTENNQVTTIYKANSNGNYRIYDVEFEDANATINYSNKSLDIAKKDNEDEVESTIPEGEDNVSSEDMSYEELSQLVNGYADIIEETVTLMDIKETEQSSPIVEGNIDAMVNNSIGLIVQESTELNGDNISESIEIFENQTTNAPVQLWVE